MSEESNPSKAAEPTPEQLLKLLDLQIAASRARRSDTPRRRGALTAVAVLLILGAALGALLILQQMISDLPRSPRGIETPADVQKSQ